jgi:uncharacterized protein YcbX
MEIPLGYVRELVRYPVKSMAGIATESATLGWHGLDGDRRFAFRRTGDDGGFPWLSASRFPELLLYHPEGLDETSSEPLPTHVRTPSGVRLELRGAELRDEVARCSGIPVELMQFRNGIFDDGAVSVISLATIAGIGLEAGMQLDRRRFRANIVLDTKRTEPFLEDGWVGGTLLFGDREPRPAVAVTARDLRCVMVNLDPDSAAHDARVMKAVVRMTGNYAGVYGTVVQTGVVEAGQAVTLIARGDRD